MRQFFKGLSYNLEGFRYFFANPKLWKFVLIPTLINFLALIVLVTLYVSYFNDIFLLLAKPLNGFDILNPQNFWAHFFDGTLWIVRNLFKVLIFLLALILIFIVTFFVSAMINAPFYEALSEKILAMQGWGEERPLLGLVKNFFFSLKIELYKILIFMGVVLGLFFLSWVPVAGPLFSVLMFLFMAWMFALGLCTYPLVLKQRPFSEMLTWGFKNKFLLVGFGLPSLIPLVGYFIIFFQVVGGTLVYLDQEATNAKSNVLT